MLLSTAITVQTLAVISYSTAVLFSREQSNWDASSWEHSFWWWNMRNADCIKLETKPRSSSQSILRGHELKHKPWPVQSSLQLKEVMLKVRNASKCRGLSFQETDTPCVCFILAPFTISTQISISSYTTAQHWSLHSAECTQHRLLLDALGSGQLKPCTKGWGGEDKLDVLCSTRSVFGKSWKWTSGGGGGCL